MTTSAQQEFLTEIAGDADIPSSKLAYFEARLSGVIHQSLLKLFGLAEQEKKFTRKKLARRIGCAPELITRRLSSPSNLRSDTISNLSIGMGFELESFIFVNLATGERIQLPNSGEDKDKNKESITPSKDSEVLSLDYHKNFKTRAVDYQTSSRTYSEGAESNQSKNLLEPSLTERKAALA
jgi:hypothetical protein